MSKNNDNEIDILDINNKILNNFEKRKETLGKFKERLEDMNKSLEFENIRHGVKDTLQHNIFDLIEYIKDIEENISLNFYMLESVDLIEKYKEILNSPIKISFVGKVSKNNKEKQNIINQYLEVASKYIDLNINFERKEKIICKNCSGKDFDIDDQTNIYICSNCSAQQLILKNVSSYRDINRINISTKYSYDRKVHFRDTVKQYQGKQLATILPEVYEKLEEQFELHHLLEEGDKNSAKEIRFKNITKEHINIFLKELEYTKHYENINLIHYNMTGKKPDNIGYLEDKLLDDFDALTDAYDRKFKHLDRKNFINTQYILYQLLLKHRHPCKKEDFTMLKTIDRKHFHDEVCKVLFQECGWTFVSFW
jgi:hypothetical protein